MVKDRQYDVVIVGAGPAGIFAALELTKQAKLDVLILDKGRNIDKRHCPIYNSDRKCIHCKFCDRISGWGGAGAYSDGKLTLSNEVGGQLQDVIGPEALGDLVKYVDDIYVAFGAPEKVYGHHDDTVDNLIRKVALAEFRLLYFPVRHMGTDGSAAVLRAMRDELLERGVTIRCSTEVSDVLVKDGRAEGGAHQKWRGDPGQVCHGGTGPRGQCLGEPRGP